jgi:CRP/FNR family transcriptional regulator
MFETATASVDEDAAPAMPVRLRDKPIAETPCARVSLADLARLVGSDLDIDRRVADEVFAVRRLAPGETLYRAGDRFDAIYIVRSGFCKTVALDAAGEELVLNFPMAGDVIGLDGVDEGRYAADVTAIDMSSVAVVPFAQLARLGRESATVDRLLYSIFSRELVRQRNMMRLLNTLTAEARLATFLLELAERFGRLGYSRTSFALRMTRAEIGSYLGMKLETVSRMFSAFAAAGIVAVDRKQIVLHDPMALRAIVGPGPAQKQGA